MGTLSQLVCRLSSIHIQFTGRHVAASSNLNIPVLNWFQNKHTQNEFVRKISISSIVHKSIEEKNNVVTPGFRKKAKFAKFSADQDKIILKHVQKYGDAIETWKKLAVKFGRKYPDHIKRRYINALENEPSVHGWFTPEEDKIILDNVEKYGQCYNTWEKTAKQLNRGYSETIGRRHEYLTSNKGRKMKKWSLIEDKKLLEVIYNLKRMKSDDIASLCSVNQAEFGDISKELQRTKNACYLHWQEVVLPILKTHIMGLPQNTDWMRDIQRYIVNKQIKSMDELDFDLMDIREDEEQEVKCQEVMELFLTAGYFRARIKVCKSSQI